MATPVRAQTHGGMAYSPWALGAGLALSAFPLLVKSRTRRSSEVPLPRQPAAFSGWHACAASGRGLGKGRRELVMNFEGLEMIAVLVVVAVVVKVLEQFGFLEGITDGKKGVGAEWGCGGTP
ncbi:hypothetical protein ANANG_G00095310 [Anguilla anguilla]|uniref:Uncharacterized protein n=1 Tax=Anguilla anguilla TaxID=7936 RepID=A0A9D3MFP6_ANGAN|nr:hypothetical protein ANANG_G00095310 [Anguilla anguilla]